MTPRGETGPTWADVATILLALVGHVAVLSWALAVFEQAP